MKFGLSSQNYELVLKLAVRPLQGFSAKVYAFGSRVRGSHHPFSDLDLIFDDDVSNQKIPLSVISKIRENLEESSLPIKVDLVRKSELAKSYLSSVEKEMVLIQD